MSSHPVIDADGHIIEDKEKLRSYLEPPYNRRGGSLVAAFPRHNAAVACVWRAS